MASLGHKAWTIIKTPPCGPPTATLAHLEMVVAHRRRCEVVRGPTRAPRPRSARVAADVEKGHRLDPPREKEWCLVLVIALALGVCWQDVTGKRGNESQWEKSCPYHESDVAREVAEAVLDELLRA